MWEMLSVVSTCKVHITTHLQTSLTISHILIFQSASLYVQFIKILISCLQMLTVSCMILDF